MKKGNLVKFIEWNDPHKDKVGVVLRVSRGRTWDILVHLPETNEKTFRLARHLELIK